MAKIPVFDDRAGQLMKLLVESYISDGQPVGSKVLAAHSDLNVSAATVRNVMADLEKMGLIHSPHTSAGRVPTVQGYRIFVDSLLSVKRPDKQLLNKLAAHIRDTEQQSIILEKVSETLSGVTHLASLVVLPKKELLSLTQIEFIPLSNQRILVILVHSDNEVQNRVIQTEREYTSAKLQQMSNYLNHLLVGKSIREACDTLAQEMENTRRQMDDIMHSAITMANHAFMDQQEQEKVMIRGETNLMQYEDIANMERMRKLFEAFHEKQHILAILNQVSNADGVKLFIGNESQYQPLNDCSVVAAPYKVEGQTMGVLGVIGPTRMAYDKVIPIVDLTAKLLSSALNHAN